MEDEDGPPKASFGGFLVAMALLVGTPAVLCCSGAMLTSRMEAKQGRDAVASPPPARGDLVRDGLMNARDVVGSKEACADVTLVSQAWAGLRLAESHDPDWKEILAITPKLEKCRASSAVLFRKASAAERVAGRETLKTGMQTAYWDNGLNIKLTLRGTTKNEMVMDFVLFNDASVHQMTSDGALVGGLESAGFKKLTLDGFDRRWRFDLDPSADDEAADIALAMMGMDQPLSLTGPGPR